MFEDYSCPVPELGDRTKLLIRSTTPFKMIMQTLTGKNKPEIKVAETLSLLQQAAEIFSLAIASLNKKYDGGEFCAGLSAAYYGKEAAKLVAIHTLDRQMSGIIFQP